MNLNKTNNEDQYRAAIKRIIDIFHAEEGTPESEELSLLLPLVIDYESKYELQIESMMLMGKND